MKKLLKILTEQSHNKLENSVNDFVKKNKVINIVYQCSSSFVLGDLVVVLTAFIEYEYGSPVIDLNSTTAKEEFMAASENLFNIYYERGKNIVLGVKVEDKNEG